MVQLYLVCQNVYVGVLEGEGFRFIYMMIFTDVGDGGSWNTLSLWDVDRYVDLGCFSGVC